MKEKYNQKGDLKRKEREKKEKEKNKLLNNLNKKKYLNNSVCIAFTIHAMRIISR